MAYLYLFINFLILPFLITTLTQDDKDKVTSCLLLYRHRKFQDKDNFGKMMVRLKKVVQNPEEKISMFALSNCYDSITVEVAKEIYKKFNQNRYIDSMLEENKKLLNLENFENVDFQEYSKKLEKFAPVLNEVYTETKNANKVNDSLANKLLHPTNGKFLGFIDRDIAVIILVCVICMVCSILYYCYKVNKLENEYSEYENEVQDNVRKNRAKYYNQKKKNENNEDDDVDNQDTTGKSKTD